MWRRRAILVFAEKYPDTALRDVKTHWGNATSVGGGFLGGTAGNYLREACKLSGNHPIQLGVPTVAILHPSADGNFLNFVGSDGDFYLVSLGYEYRPPTCQVYRLRVVTDDPNDNHQICLLVEKVEDLGDDRVFFIGVTGAFSVSASRDLPPPWKGN